MDTLHIRWLGLTQGEAKPVMSLLLLQLLSGAWILSQGSFLPIYLEEQLGYAALVIASIIAIGQAAGMVAGLWGLSGVAGSLQTLGGSSYLTRMADPQRLGVLSALYALSLTLGGALAGPAAGWLLDTAGFRLYGLVGLGIVAISAALAVTRLPSIAPPV